jgi:hypothetical protein
VGSHHWLLSARAPGRLDTGIERCLERAVGQALTLPPASTADRGPCPPNFFQPTHLSLVYPVVLHVNIINIIVIDDHTPWCWCSCYVTVPEVPPRSGGLLGTEPTPIAGSHLRAFDPSSIPPSGDSMTIRLFWKPHSSVNQSRTLQLRTAHRVLSGSSLGQRANNSLFLFRTPFPTPSTKNVERARVPT